MKFGSDIGYEATERRKLRGRDLELTFGKRGRSRDLLEARGAGAPCVAKGLRLFRRWSGFDPESVEVRKVPADTPPVLVRLGELRGVIYRSSKFDKRSRNYIHDTEAPRPELFATPDGRRLVILGGRVTVRPEGLVG